MMATISFSTDEWELRQGQTEGECQACHRVIGLTRPGEGASPMRRHKDPNSRRRNGWCKYSGTMNWEPIGNIETGPVTGLVASNEAEPEPFAQLMAGLDPVAELTQWWISRAATEADMVCAKAIEYGATDLRDLGYQILEMAGRKPHADSAPAGTAELATEIGIAFYAMGKIARIAAAIKEGRRPSFDSWLDLGVYARMAQRVHTHGGWPGV